MIVPDDILLLSRTAKKNPLLKAEEEKDLARKIAGSRVDLWKSVFSYPPYRHAMISFLIPLLPKTEGSEAGFDLQTMIEQKISGFSDIEHAANFIAQGDPGLLLFEKLNSQWKRVNPFGKRKPSKNSKVFLKYQEDLKTLAANHRAHKEKFWKANIRLALSLTKKYDHGMVPFADLLHEALIGLMTAVERFNPEREIRFSTYATWWVRHALGRFLANHGRTVRWPAHIVSAFNKLKNARSKIIYQGQYPTVEVLSKNSGISINKIERICSLSLLHPLSLEEPRPWMDGEMLKDSIVDENSSIDEGHFVSKLYFEHLKNEIQNLPGIEGDIIFKRFGLSGNEPMTLREIAQQHSLSRERIRQLEVQAIKRLREIAK